MSKTDTVALFSLIFARKVHFLEKSSVRENFRQNLAEASSAKPLIVEDHVSPALQAASWPWPSAPPCRKVGCAADPPGIAGR